MAEETGKVGGAGLILGILDEIGNLIGGGLLSAVVDPEQPLLIAGVALIALESVSVPATSDRFQRVACDVQWVDA